MLLFYCRYLVLSTAFHEILRFHRFHQNFTQTFIKNAHKKRSLISETSSYHCQSLIYIRLTNVSMTFNAAPNAAAATL